MLEEEDYGVSYDQVLQYARESFGRLLRKLQLCVSTAYDIYEPHDNMEDLSNNDGQIHL